jgi:hypothetical protein
MLYLRRIHNVMQAKLIVILFYYRAEISGEELLNAAVRDYAL